MLPNQDSEPGEVTPGETEFFFGANAPEEDGETLLAFEDLPEHIKKAIQEKRKQKPMITLNRTNATETQTSNAPKGVQYLRPLHIKNPTGQAAKIYKVTTDKPDNFGNPYVVYFTMEGQKYSKGFKPTSDNLASLVTLFGEDEAKWIGKGVLIGSKADDDQAARLVFLALPVKAGK